VRYRLLIVDDDELSLETLDRVLRGDHELVHARSAEQAIELLKLRGDEIDLILADKSMPGRSGVELLVEAKMLTGAMRIILTAYPDARDLHEAINRGEVYRYVTKPWSPAELRMVVSQALSHYQLGRDNAELVLALQRKNAELKAMATRVADAFLKRLDARALSPHVVDTTRALLLAASPTARTAAQAIIVALGRVRDQLRAGRDDRQLDLDGVARQCLAEARRILSVLDDLDQLAG
jgi:response regulator RpfG family c-di-GMP phosphodiesterase